MALYEEWQKIVNDAKNDEERQTFWKDYLAKEKDIYIGILKNKETKIQGKVSELAAKYEMDDVMFSGFLDGINTSLEEELDVDSLTSDSEIDATIVYDKLYVNMIDAKADWLYELEEWDDIYSQDERDTMRRDYNRSKMAVSTKVGRNDKCPCGSGKKYKKCCGKEE
jgi:preprotein translocase subunit SecA